MAFVRVVICRDVTTQLRKAVTIATRYSAFRHQSELKPGYYFLFKGFVLLKLINSFG